jgi:carnitine-CoA ligase
MTGTPATFAELWQRAVARDGERTFLVFRSEDGEIDTWTYEEFDRVVRDTSALLVAHGVAAGDAVHLCLRNCPAFIALWLAAAQLGAWMVPVDPASTSRDVESQLARVTPAIGFYATSRADTYRAGLAEDSRLTTFALEETAADVRADGRLRAGDGRTVAADPVAPGDRLAVMFTSGTTSQPKGVVLTQANYRHVAEGMAAEADLHADHRWLVTLPLFHANAQFYCFAPAPCRGSSTG